MEADSARPTTILFDVDDTLYPHSSGVWEAIGARIERFMVERCAIPPDLVPQLRAEYLHSFGTTLNGLRVHYGIDPFDYLRYVHDVPLERYLQPNEDLQRMLSRLPQRKTIFSNSDQNHSRRVLRRLGIEDQFDGVVDIVALNFVNKPNPEAYRTAMQLLGLPVGGQCVLVDDQVRNLKPAMDLGWITVWVGEGQGGDGEGAGFRIERIADLAEQVPILGA